MAKLRIERSSELNNKARDFGLYVNGDKIGTISNGETKEFDLKPGKHQLMAKIDWCQSQTLEFDLPEDKTQTVRLTGFKYGNVIIPFFALIFLSYYVLKVAFNIDLFFLIFVGLAVFLYPMYFITLGRKRYIRINELK
jgi:hypothetical protein